MGDKTHSRDPIESAIASLEREIYFREQLIEQLESDPDNAERVLHRLEWYKQGDVDLGGSDSWAMTRLGDYVGD
jgi:uncharacterized protein (DUF3084 family)